MIDMLFGRDILNIICQGENEIKLNK